MYLLFNLANIYVYIRYNLIIKSVHNCNILTQSSVLCSFVETTFWHTFYVIYVLKFYLCVKMLSMC